MASQPVWTVEAAAEALVQGEVVAFPTETVYGLGARADRDDAVARIFALKGRPADHPLIVHVADVQAASTFASDLPPVAQRLMDACWPGPLTVIVPRRPGIAQACAGGQASIGLRCPSHPVAHALLVEAARRGVAGVAAPSANRFGRVSPTTAAHVASEFGPALPVLDGGPCEVGIESTIIDCTRGRAVLLRPGMLSRAELAHAAGEPLQEADTAAPRASGTLESHYAPRARVRLLDSPDVLQPLTREDLPCVALYSSTRPAWCEGTAGWVWRPMPIHAADAARDLFAALRELDEQVQRVGGGEIWVQSPPQTPDWEGVRDRLRRAAA